MKLQKILLLDDEETVILGYKRYLSGFGYTVQSASNLKDGRKELENENYDAVILDLNLPDGNSLDLIPEIRSKFENIVILVVTGESNIQTAVKAMRLGANNFLPKPISIDELCTVLIKTLEVEELRRREAIHKRLSKKDTNVCFGRSQIMQQVIHHATVAAKSESIILLLGETGTGKGVLARWIHENGIRKDNAFIELNCSTLRGELLRSELYGHTRGAFTSAIKDRDGLIEISDGGTLFLDEIGDMDLSVQAELLKTLEEKSFRRIGENTIRKSDFRLICATNRNLHEAAERGTFRNDLYYRICVFPITLPALRDRAEDIPILSEHILKGYNYEYPISSDVADALKRYSWPGNIRELRNMLERAVLLSQGKQITMEHFPGLEPQGAKPIQKNYEIWNLEQIANEHILKALEHFKGDKNLASKALGISLSSLYRKLDTIDQLETA